MLSITGFTQAKTGMENYNFLGQGEGYAWMPILHYETPKGLYAELRYNYEDANTLSFFGGKTITGGKTVQYSVIPMAGFSTGKFTGVSLAVNAEVEWKNIYLSLQTQYSVATKSNASNFFFNWSELGYNISKNIFGGFAIQYTLQKDLEEIEPGFVVGFNFNNFSVPVYVFNPFGREKYFVLGLSFECDFKKKR